MREAVQAKCPNCTKVLRIPSDLLDKSIRCKHCGFAFQAKKKSSSQVPAPAPTARMTAAPTRPAAPLPPAPLVEELPEYSPPAPAVRNSHTKHRSARPIVESLPAAGPDHYTPAFEQAGHKHTGRGAYKRRSGTPWGTWAAVGLVTLCAIVAGAVIVLKPDLFKDKPTTDPDKRDVANNDGNNQNDKAPDISGGGPNRTPDNTTGPRTGTPIASGAFPRRLLAITATNYLYANSISYGQALPAEDEKSRRDFYKFMEKLALGWKIPPEQRYYISDGPLEKQKIDTKHPPLKSVIMGSIDQFLETSRPQDRIVIVFAGHAIEKDGAAYLVPQEGEFEEVGTLIPVKELYEKLAKCPAQEKLIIYDVCRFDTSRGAERPIFGVMTEGLEKALHDSPDGVSVWTTCSAGQYSYEQDYYQVSVRGLRAEIFGPTFFNVLLVDSKAALSKSVTGKGPQSPQEALPVQPLAEYLNDYVNQTMMDIEGKPQTPKLTYKHKADLVAYNPGQPPAAKFTLTDAPKSVSAKEVAAMFAEFQVPTIKTGNRKKGTEVQLGAAFPFTEQDLKDYLSDGVTEAEIKKNPQKYPLRAAVIEARDEIRAMDTAGKSEELPEEFRVLPGDEGKKKLVAIQRGPAKRLEILDTQRDKLEAIGKDRAMEKSKRWQANYDYILAQVKARKVYINQYNLMLGKVRKDELPELVKDPAKEINQNGWRLAAVPEINGDPEGKTLAKEVKKDLETLVSEHPRTPWALQAKRERGLSLGLQWQGVTFK